MTAETVLEQVNRFMAGDDDVVEQIALGTSLGQLAISLGEELTSGDPEIRGRATLLFSLALSHSQDETEWPALVQFYKDRLHDTECVPAVLLGVFNLVSRSGIPSPMVVELCQEMLWQVNTQTLPQIHRHRIFSTCLRTLELTTDTSMTFIQAFVTAMDGEKDPRNLIVCFTVYANMLAQCPEVPEDYAEELFDVVSCYFPVTFTAPPSSEITGHQITEALLTCLSAHPILSTYCFAFYLTKFASSDDNTITQVLWGLKHALGVYPSSLWMEHVEILIDICEQVILEPSSDTSLGLSKEILSLITFYLCPVYSLLDAFKGFGSRTLLMATRALQTSPESKRARAYFQVLLGLCSGSVVVAQYCVFVFYRDLLHVEGISPGSVLLEYLRQLMEVAGPAVPGRELDEYMEALGETLVLALESSTEVDDAVHAAKCLTLINPAPSSTAPLLCASVLKYKDMNLLQCAKLVCEPEQLYSIVGDLLLDGGAPALACVSSLGRLPELRDRILGKCVESRLIGCLTSLLELETDTSEYMSLILSMALDMPNTCNTSALVSSVMCRCNSTVQSKVLDSAPQSHWVYPVLVQALLPSIAATIPMSIVESLISEQQYTCVASLINKREDLEDLISDITDTSLLLVVGKALAMKGAWAKFRVVLSKLLSEDLAVAQGIGQDIVGHGQLDQCNCDSGILHRQRALHEVFQWIKTLPAGSWKDAVYVCTVSNAVAPPQDIDSESASRALASSSAYVVESALSVLDPVSAPVVVLVHLLGHESNQVRLGAMRSLLAVSKAPSSDTGVHTSAVVRALEPALDDPSRATRSLARRCRNSWYTMKK